jgi:hypothetical protein
METNESTWNFATYDALPSLLGVSTGIGNIGGSLKSRQLYMAARVTR